MVLREGSKLSEQDVQAHMKERLAGYKQLTGGVQFMDAIPKVCSLLYCAFPITENDVAPIRQNPETSSPRYGEAREGVTTIWQAIMPYIPGARCELYSF